VDLTWSGATSDMVDIYRNNARIATTLNNGLCTDRIGGHSHRTYTYRVCAAGTQTCSNQATVIF
jgi:hypothetical protein